MFSFARMFARREIDQWRDEFNLLASATLNKLAAELIESVGSDINSVTWREGVFAQSGFLARKVAPLVHAATEPVVDSIMTQANRGLAQIVEHHALCSVVPGATDTAGSSFEGWADIATATGPLVGGGVLAAVLPAAAVTTTTAWFGLVTASTVNWPIVIGGGALAGVAVATGAVNAARIKDKAEARLRRRARNLIVTYLLEGTAKQPSILAQLTRALDDAAEQAKRL